MPPVLGRLLRISGIGALVAFAYGLVRSAKRQTPPPASGSASWPSVVPDAPAEQRSGPVQFATPAETTPAEATPSESAGGWVEPVDGGCPDSHPIKGNAGSMIFHVPGGMSYERTQPERCYCTAEDAVADGFRQAKR